LKARTIDLRLGSNREYLGLVTLLELLQFYANDFLRLTQNLMLGFAVLLHDEIREKDSGDAEALALEHEKQLAACQAHCRALNLRISAMHLIALREKAEARELRRHDILNVLDTIHRELSCRVFLAVPAERCKTFSEPLEGWDQMLTAFPESQEDIEEMNKCYALSRYTAAVFHSLLVVEHGLIKLGHRIGVTDPKPGWDATYKRVDWLVNNRGHVPADLSFNFLEQTKARLDSMKLAWRNKVNHAAGKLMIEKTGFTDFAAEEVIIACRSFMRHLAEGLPK
jgi:hypothetical protein